jgi:hypothetical protein
MQKRIEGKKRCMVMSATNGGQSEITRPVLLRGPAGDFDAQGMDPGSSSHANRRETLCRSLDKPRKFPSVTLPRFAARNDAQ